jgi:hypothetical protein
LTGPSTSAVNDSGTGTEDAGDTEDIGETGETEDIGETGETGDTEDAGETDELGSAVTEVTIPGTCAPTVDHG